jgi:hypothetical protein
MTDKEDLKAAIKVKMQKYWDQTGKWDPWINGKMEKELEDLDPNDGTSGGYGARPGHGRHGLLHQLDHGIVDKRSHIVDHFSWEHDLMVGQRMAMDGYLRAALEAIDALPIDGEANEIG